MDMFSELVLTFAVPVLLSIFAIRLWSLFILSTNDPESRLPLPPGGVGLPFLGETPLLALKGFTFFADKREKYGTIYKTHIMGRPTVRVFGFENIRAILKAEEVNVTMQWPPSARSIIGSGSLMASKGELHRIRRDSLIIALSGHAVSEFLPTIQSTVREHLCRWLNRGTILGEECSRYLALDLTLRCLLGYEYSQKEVYDIAQNMIMMEHAFFTIPYHYPGSPFSRALEARRSMLSLLDKAILKTAADVNNNSQMRSALGLLLQLPNSHQLEETDIKDICIELLFCSAGISGACCTLLQELPRHGSAIELTTNELYHYDLLETPRNGDLTSAKIADLSYISRVSKEVLRLTPPVGGGCRTVLRTMELGGYQIPKNWSILYSIRDQHDTRINNYGKFDPDRWRPDRDFTRFDDHLDLVFGGGGHRCCVGREFALLCLRVMLIEVVRGYQWRVLESNPVMKYFPMAHSAGGLPLTISEANPLRQRRITL